MEHRGPRVWKGWGTVCSGALRMWETGWSEPGGVLRVRLRGWAAQKENGLSWEMRLLSRKVMEAGLEADLHPGCLLVPSKAEE